MNMKMSIAALALGVMTVGLASPSDAGTATKRIAFSVNYAGNTFRQQMIKAFQNVADKATSDGIIKGANVFVTSENSVTEQAAQVRSLVLQGYDAIVITAASGDALNGAVKEACDAGIFVVTFDGLVSEPCAYKIEVDYHSLGLQQGQFFKQRLPDGGNLLQVRGIAGIPAEQQISDGHFDGLKDTKFKVAGTVYGQWTQTVARKEVAAILPTLPQIAGVLTEGGDGFGTAQAFADAGRAVPVIFLGNRFEELKWWKEQRDANGYKTRSAASNPASSTLAFWVAQQLLDGVKVPNHLPDNLVTVGPDELDSALANLKSGEVVSKSYTQDDTINLIKASQ
ncbi:MAG: ABC transporter substrate-binding protein [Mesorhizobium sp.]|nr:substrate-binding domain-containing protein [Mesorhizobium sp.]TIV62151.1 MAG: ABC transporter substrate-binding protein [Mesorhizobium sp.]